LSWHWDKIHQEAFDNEEATITKDVTLIYPDYTQGFEVYTDSSKLQLGAIITQANRSLAFFFFRKKTSPAQQKYSMTEQELLAIVETLKEFKDKLWGQQRMVYTDHKNLMQDTLGLISNRVYRWILLLEEYNPPLCTSQESTTPLQIKDLYFVVRFCGNRDILVAILLPM